jgi:hypothetical protein
VIVRPEVSMVGRKVRDAAEAGALLAAVTSSGMRRAEWAHRNGIDARSLNAWRLILGRGRGPRTRTVKPGLRLAELVPTTRSPRQRLLPDTYTVRCGPFAVEVGADFNEGVLGRLLRVVAAC